GEGGGERPLERADGGEKTGVTGGGPTPVGEDQDGDHDAEEDCRLPQRAAGRRGRERGEPGGLGALLAEEEQVHGDADDDGEYDGADRAGDAELKAEDLGGEDDREGVDRRTGIEKRRGRAESRAQAINAGEERQHGAGTDGEDGAGDGGNAVAE